MSLYLPVAISFYTSIVNILLPTPSKEGIVFKEKIQEIVQNRTCVSMAYMTTDTTSSSPSPLRLLKWILDNIYFQQTEVSKCHVFVAQASLCVHLVSSFNVVIGVDTGYCMTFQCYHTVDKRMTFYITLGCFRTSFQ